jgi:hyperosmotically inducible periplasmic protein
MKKSHRFHHLAPLAVITGAALMLGGCDKGPTKPVVAAPANGAATAPNVPDSEVTVNVKTALQRSDSLKAFDINVVTLKGDVRLIGVVDSQVQLDEALNIARAANGAHSIHDELTVRK